LEIVSCIGSWEECIIEYLGDWCSQGQWCYISLIQYIHYLFNKFKKYNRLLPIIMTAWYYMIANMIIFHTFFRFQNWTNAVNYLGLELFQGFKFCIVAAVMILWSLHMVALTNPFHMWKCNKWERKKKNQHGLGIYIKFFNICL